MAVITAILPSTRKAGRFEILVDGAPRALLAIEAIERLRLAVGQPVDERMSELLDREAAQLATFDRALAMLALRGRSTQELRRQLLRKGEPAHQVDAAIERLLDVGFLDDASFARQFTRSKALGAGLSKRRLSQELAKRGVSGPESRDAIEQVFAEEGIDDSVGIERVARKKLRSLAKLDPIVQRRRLFAFLARRGYDVDDIRAVVETLCSGRVEGADGVHHPQ